VLSIGAFLLVAHQIRDLIWLERLTWIFLALGCVHPWAVSAAASGPHDAGLSVGRRGVLGLARGIGLQQAVLNRRLDLFIRVLLGGLALATMAVALTAGREWTSGWLPSLVALLVIVWGAKPRLGLFLTCVIAVGVLANWQPILDQWVLIGGQYGNEWSLATRLEACA